MTGNFGKVELEQLEIQCAKCRSKLNLQAFLEGEEKGHITGYCPICKKHVLAEQNKIVFVPLD